MCLTDSSLPNRCITPVTPYKTTTRYSVKFKWFYTTYTQSKYGYITSPDTKIQKKKRPLTTPELLNVDCDERASTLNDTLIDPTNPHHPTLPASYPHLQLKQSIIIRQLQSNLRDAATQAEYHKYLCEKFNWEATTPELIHWHTFRLAYNHLKNRSENHHQIQPQLAPPTD